MPDDTTSLGNSRTGEFSDFQPDSSTDSSRLYDWIRGYRCVRMRHIDPICVFCRMQHAPSHILVVINTFAGNSLANRVYPQLFKYLKGRQIPFFPYYTKGQGKDSYNIEQILKGKAFDTVCILGGDGTVNTVVNARGVEYLLIHVIPCGTGNDLAEQLSGKRSVHQHIRALERGDRRKVDLWRCNDRRFVSIFGLGFDGVVCERMNASRKYQFPRKLVYWVAILRELLFFNEVQVAIDGNPQEIFMLSLANNSQVGGGFMIAPPALLNDGLLDLVVIRKASLKQRIQHLLRLRKGKHLGLEIVEHSQVERCELVSEQPIAAQVDGELLYDSHYSVSLERQLTFIC